MPGWFPQIIVALGFYRLVEKPSQGVWPLARDFWRHSVAALEHSREVWEDFEGAHGQFVEAFGQFEKAMGCFGVMREVFECVGEAS